MGDDRCHAGGEGEAVVDAFARLAADGFAEDAVRAEVARLTDRQLRMLEDLMRHLAGDHDEQGAHDLGTAHRRREGTAPGGSET